jgi:hypothetical protein
MGAAANSKKQQQIPPLLYGMTNKTGNGKSKCGDSSLRSE